MNINFRLSKLEAKTSSGDDFKVFRVIGETEEELQAGIDRLIASGEALPTGHYVNEEAPDQVLAWFLRFFEA